MPAVSLDEIRWLAAAEVRATRRESRVRPQLARQHRHPRSRPRLRARGRPTRSTPEIVARGDDASTTWSSPTSRRRRCSTAPVPTSVGPQPEPRDLATAPRHRRRRFTSTTTRRSRFFASGAVKELRVLSLEFPYVMAKPPHVVASHLDVEKDVGPDRRLHRRTPNSVDHGEPRRDDARDGRSRRRTIASNTLTSEVPAHRAGASGSPPGGNRASTTWRPDAVDWMYRHAESVIYPSRDATRRPEGGERRA